MVSVMRVSYNAYQNASLIWARFNSWKDQSGGNCAMLRGVKELTEEELDALAEQLAPRILAKLKDYPEALGKALAVEVGRGGIGSKILRN